MYFQSGQEPFDDRNHAAGESDRKYLAEKCVDIPQTTLYRYLKRMTDDGLLKIVGETPIRGTVEKDLCIDL